MLSVIITCFNAAGEIGVQLDALAQQALRGFWEVVIADGGSRDGTTAMVENYRSRLPELRVLDASDAPGIAHGFNVGAAGARGDHLFFCEADDQLAPGCLAAVSAGLKVHEAVACRADLTRLNEPWVRRVRPTVGGLHASWFPPYLPHASTMGLGIRRELFDRIGGFDPEFRAMQDADLCFRLQLAGAELVELPEAVVNYRLRTRLPDIYRQARLYSLGFAQLQRKYASYGEMAASPWLWPLRGWKPILASLPSLRSREGRGRLAWYLGWQTGRIRGSVRYRFPAY